MLAMLPGNVVGPSKVWRDRLQAVRVEYRSRFSTRRAMGPKQTPTEANKMRQMSVIVIAATNSNSFFDDGLGWK